jgi:hypothetical protein
MERGAFGVIPRASGARFADGQQWLEGSSPIFARFSQQQLLEYFPMLSDCQSRIPPAWKHRDGVVHVRRRRSKDGDVNWFIVHCFQPEYSIERSVPLWLGVRMSADEFEAGFVLGAVLQEFDQIRSALETDPTTVLRWVTGNEVYPPAAATVEDVRSALGLAWAIESEGNVAVGAIHDRTYWRAAQLALETLGSKSNLETPGDLWVSVRLEPSGRVATPAGATCDLLLEPHSSVSVTPVAFMARGVQDAALILDAGERAFVRQATDRRRGQPQARLEELLTVPLKMLGVEHVDESECDGWARSQYSHFPDRCDDLLLDLVAMGRLHAHRRGVAARCIAHLILLQSTHGLPSSAAMRELTQRMLGWPDASRGPSKVAPPLRDVRSDVR